jgi:hypothetical protein
MRSLGDGFRWAIICVGFALTTALHAQDTTTTRVVTGDSIRPPVGPCWRGRPKPKCEWFAITEVGFYQNVVSTSFVVDRFPGQAPAYRVEDYTAQLTWEFGAMRNRGAKSAIGAALLLGADDDVGRIGVKGRYRRWLDPQGLALDLSAGVVRGATRKNGRAAILSGDASLNYHDFGAITARAEAARVNGRTTAALFGGVRLGSKPAAAATVVMAGLFALVVASFSGWGD